MSDLNKQLNIAAVGMITPVGADAPGTAMAVRAGITAHRHSQYYTKDYTPMVITEVPDDALPPLSPDLMAIPALTDRQQRLIRLVTPALHQVLDAIPIKDPIPLFLAGPQRLPG